MAQRSRGISDAEKLFVYGGVAADCRVDGRKSDDYRPVQVEFSCVNGAFGSARVYSTSYELIVAVKGSIVQIEERDKANPFVFSVAPAVTSSSFSNSDELEGFGYIAKTLSSVFNECSKNASSCLNVVPEQSQWQLYVDILFVRMDGNLYDLCGLAAKLALLHTELPKLGVVENDFGQREFDIPNQAEVPVMKLMDCHEFISTLPIFITVNRIGPYNVFDCDQIEETCSNCRFILAFQNQLLTYASKVGAGCFGPDTFDSIINQGIECAKKTDDAILRALKH